MCGIFGLVDNNPSDKKSTLSDISRLFYLSERRGREAAGIAVESGDLIDVYKDSVSASRMLLTPAYKDFIGRNVDRAMAESSIRLIGHTRLVTNGIQTIDKNNQPIKKNGLVVVHNGIITNEKEIWESTQGIDKNSQVDSELFPSLIHKYREDGYDIVESVRKCFNSIKGEASIAVLFSDLDLMVLATNTGSIFTIQSDTKMAFLSEKYLAENAIRGNNPIVNVSGEVRNQVHQLKSGNMMLVKLSTLETETFSIEGNYQSINIAPLLSRQKKIEDKFEKDELRRKSLRRCTRCILPETMPFITFDSEGVCNFCRAHKPKELLGRDKLEIVLDQHRSDNGEADCLVAFSGGRDSSYGLHLMKNEFGMNPVAYTYDWGMVTDIARRNQARMCGQLGVEHLWVSADIKSKRKNIQQNVKAWLNKPDLGMIPLFMAGDKQFFWYANKTMEQTGIKLMVFSQNHFEKTNFKSGFAGAAPIERLDGKIYNIGLTNKMRLASYYGRNYLCNPRYINRSIYDTLWAYISFYFIKQDYLYLFDYIEWNEDDLNSELLGKYDWEIAQDTSTTWRIGDGTAPFYNYIYHTVTGFSENDTFRSNQIRDGHLTREKALRLSHQENMPRWDSIREYLQMIDVSFDDAIQAIDNIKKLY